MDIICIIERLDFEGGIKCQMQWPDCKLSVKNSHYINLKWIFENFFSILFFFNELESSGLSLTDIIGIQGITTIDLVASVYLQKLFSKFEFLIFCSW